MVEQIVLLERWIEQLDRVVFIGDDDHMSLLFAKFFTVQAIVYDIDQRVVESINAIASQEGLPVEAHLYDVREPLPPHTKNDFFYVNPPYSSKTAALGVKVWLMRALEATRPGGCGVLVFPGVTGNNGIDWIAPNLIEINKYLIEAGCVIVGIDQDRHSYADTNDKYLYSTNYIIKRVTPAPVPIVIPPSGGLLYR